MSDGYEEPQICKREGFLVRCGLFLACIFLAIAASCWPTANEDDNE